MEPRECEPLMAFTPVLMSGTITQITPSYRVVVDGATVDSPAEVLDSSTYTLGARVVVALRTPQVPLIQGVAS